MCNCGNKRQQYASIPVHPFSIHQEVDAAQHKIRPDVHFEYTGSSALSVIGSITGNHYRFTQPGIVQMVDYRDAHGMMSVTVLQKVNRQ